jgi:hypothetical protein
LESDADGMFTRFAIPPVDRPAGTPLVIQRSDDTQNKWTISVPLDARAGSYDTYLDIDYVGDVARIYADGELIADHFYYGPSWRPSLRHWGNRVLGTTLTLEIDPITPKTKCYLEPSARPDFSRSKSVADVRSFRVEPQYETVLTVDAAGTGNE